MSEQELRLALLPIVSLAWYVARFVPEAIQRDRMDLWIIGAELIDGRDEGQWYNCLASLLGVGEIHYQLLSPSLPEAHNPNIFHGTLDAFLEQTDSVPDLAVIFQPGFEENTSLLEGGLGPVLRSGTKVIGSSYTEEEFERDRLMAQAFGFEVSESQDNPFSLDPSDTGLHWADRLWHFKQVLPPTGHKTDQGLIEITCFLQWLQVPVGNVLRRQADLIPVAWLVAPLRISAMGFAIGRVIQEKTTSGAAKTEEVPAEFQPKPHAPVSRAVIRST